MSSQPTKAKASGSLHSFAAGGLAGALDTTVTMPLDTIKTQMQIKQHSSVASCATKIVRNDGVSGLYYGFRPFLLQASGKAAVRFCMFDVLVRPARKGRQAHRVSWARAGTDGAGALITGHAACPPYSETCSPRPSALPHSPCRLRSRRWTRRGSTGPRSLRGGRSCAGWAPNSWLKIAPNLPDGSSPWPTPADLKAWRHSCACWAPALRGQRRPK
jgi:hypothetical protein